MKINLVTIATLCRVIIFGGFSYYTAKAELDRSSKIILKNGVAMVKVAIELKVKEVNLKLGYLL